MFAAHRRLHDALGEVYSLVAAADGVDAATERAGVGDGTADA